MIISIKIPRGVIVCMLLICFFNSSFSQDFLVLAEVKNHITFNNSGNTETVTTHKDPTILQSDNIDYSQMRFLGNLMIGASYGFSEFKGDVKEDGFMNPANIGKLYNFSISKNINKLFSVSSEILFGNLKGSHSNEDALISDASSNLVFDPYDRYEGLGEKFSTDYLEIDLITSINLERVYEYYSPKYRYYNNNNFDIYFNIGFGIASFESIKRNIGSDNYIYAYGYDDQETIQNITERKESLSERPRAGLVCYGLTFTFSKEPKVRWKLTFLERIVDTDLLDASFINDNYDKFRNISLGLDFSL